MIKQIVAVITRGICRPMAFLLCLFSVMMVADLGQTQTLDHPVLGTEPLLQLRRGVGLHGWYVWPALAPGREFNYQSDPYKNQPGALSDEEMARLRESGLDFVRLTVDPGPFLAADTAHRETLFRQVDATIRRMQRSGLTVIFDFHPNTHRSRYSYGDILTPNGRETQAFRSLVAETAARLARLNPSKVALELINEPLQGCNHADVDELNVMLGALHHAARQVAPKLTLVVDGGCQGTIDGLLELRPALFSNDPNLFYSFHFYEPYTFALAGDSTTGERALLAGVLRYPAARQTRDQVLARFEARLAASSGAAANKSAIDVRGRRIVDRYYLAPADKSRMMQRMTQVADWAKTLHILPSHILMGEFGVPESAGGPHAEPADRLQWIVDARVAAEQHGFPWSFWEYSTQLRSPRDHQRLDSAMAAALRLEPTAKPAGVPTVH